MFLKPTADKKKIHFTINQLLLQNKMSNLIAILVKEVENSEIKSTMDLIYNHLACSIIVNGTNLISLVKARTWFFDDYKESNFLDSFCIDYDPNDSLYSFQFLDEKTWTLSKPLIYKLFSNNARKIFLENDESYLKHFAGTISNQHIKTCSCNTLVDLINSPSCSSCLMSKILVVDLKTAKQLLGNVEIMSEKTFKTVQEIHSFSGKTSGHFDIFNDEEEEVDGDKNLKLKLRTWKPSVLDEIDGLTSQDKKKKQSGNFSPTSLQVVLEDYEREMDEVEDGINKINSLLVQKEDSERFKEIIENFSAMHPGNGAFYVVKMEDFANLFKTPVPSDQVYHLVSQYFWKKKNAHLGHKFVMELLRQLVESNILAHEPTQNPGVSTYRWVTMSENPEMGDV